MSHFLELLWSLLSLEIFFPVKKSDEASQLESGQRIAGMVAAVGVGLILLAMALCAVSGA